METHAHGFGEQHSSMAEKARCHPDGPSKEIVSCTSWRAHHLQQVCEAAHQRPKSCHDTSSVFRYENEAIEVPLLKTACQIDGSFDIEVRCETWHRGEKVRQRIFLAQNSYESEAVFSFAGYYHRHFPNAALLSVALTRLTVHKVGLCWTQDVREDFEHLHWRSQTFQNA